ncbi:MAG: hypothetical protein ABS46_09720 [Cytophagaceae bacterium SCN 52-12]|nr:MAG: hypothetical protein ABS46_09720 [Cytophagaceae bacterium SCN 52-12]
MTAVKKKIHVPELKSMLFFLLRRCFVYFKSGYNKSLSGKKEGSVGLIRLKANVPVNLFSYFCC